MSDKCTCPTEPRNATNHGHLPGCPAVPKKLTKQPDREFVFSPCYDDTGTEYHLVVVQGRHGQLRHSPLRAHGTGASVDLARAAALREFAHATTSLRRARPVSNA